MALSQDLISQFAKLTNNETSKSSETTVNATYKKVGNDEYVQIDGSDIWTPVNSTVEAETGERVTVLIKDHTATVTGNITTPTASSKKVSDLKDEVDEYGNTIQQLDNSIVQQGNSIIQINNNINQQNNTINQHSNLINQQGNKIQQFDSTITQQNDTITSMNNTIVSQGNQITSMNNTVTSQGNTINQHSNTISQQGNTIVQQGNTISQQGTKIETFNSDIKVLNSAFTIEDGKLTGLDEIIVDSLKTNSLNAAYANIDFANIGVAAIEKLFADSGIIKDLVVSDQKITGELVGVTIKGDLIEGNTIKADKLVVRGEDGLYYKLNVDSLGETTASSDEKYQNGLDGSVIVANSIVAEKIAVDDLVAFNATIGGFHIDTHSLYSGAKNGINNTTAGLYMGDDGQFYIGDANNRIRFYKATGDQWKLDISADSISFGTNKKTIEEAIDDKVDNLQIGGRNYALDSENEITINLVSTTGYASVSKNISSLLKNLDKNTKEFSFSCEAYSENGNTTVQMYLRMASSSDAMAVLNLGKTTTEWKRFTGVQSLQNNHTVDELSYIYIRVQGTNDDVIHIRKWKVETGNKATDWTPAPEDIDSNITNAQNTIDTYISEREVIKGTQTSTTRFWTGASNLESLKDGTEITYWVPFSNASTAAGDRTVGVDMRVNSTTTKTAGTLISSFEGSGNTNTWLNLTLKNGTETGWIPCFYSSNSRITTHYGQGNQVHLTYKVDALVGGTGDTSKYTGWWADANYDSGNTIDNRITYFGGKTGAKGIWATSLFMEDGNGTFQNICTATDGTVTSSNRTTSTTKKANTNGFKLGGTIYYTNTTYAANTNISGWGVVYSGITSLFDSRYCLNTTLTAGSLTAYKPIYLVGSINGDGLFYLDTTWWTQTPTTPGKVYVLLGNCYDSTTSYCRITLYENNPWYICKSDGTLQDFNKASLDNLEIGGKNLVKNTSKDWDDKTANTYYQVIVEDTNFFGLEAGDEYTYRIKVKVGTIKTVCARIQFYTDSTNRTSIYPDESYKEYSSYSKALSVTNGEGYLTLTGKLTEAQRAYTKMQLCLDYNKSSDLTTSENLQFCELKLEKGNKATDWTPAPEDVDASISETNGRIDTTNGRIDDNDSDISKIHDKNKEYDEFIKDVNENIIPGLNGKIDEKVTADYVLGVKADIEMNGVTKIQTSQNGFLFDDNGLTIAKAGNEITTNINEDGMSVYRSGTEVLTADNSGVNAFNLHAKTYLIVGETSRFEDYTKNDETRTGCFWIGE